MTTFTRYLNRQLLARLAVVLFAVAGFALLFDLLEVAGRIVRKADHPILALLRYGVIRLPSLLTDLFPMIALVAALLTVVDLLRHRELVILWSAGVSRMGAMLRLWPLGLLLVAGKLAIDDVAVPLTVPELRALRVGDFRPTNRPGTDKIWLRSGADIVRLPADAAATRVLENILILQRDADGRLTARIEAARAEPEGEGWRLFDVVRRPAGARPPERVAELVLPIRVDLDKVALMAKLPRELTLAELLDVIRHDGYGIGTVGGHVTWLNARIADATSPFLMCLLAFAVARRYSRLGMAMPIFAKGLAVGFVYLIANGMLRALGEVGLVPPVAAGWGAPLALLAVVVALSGAFEPRRAETAPTDFVEARP